MQGGYLDDLGDYIDRTITRTTEQGPFGLFRKLFGGRIKSLSQFKEALKSSVSSVWQSTKELTAWATVGLSIANERLGKLAWAILPDGFKDPLPKIVKEHMESPWNKLLTELFNQVSPVNETPKEDMRRKVHLRRELRNWRKCRTEGVNCHDDASSTAERPAPRSTERSKAAPSPLMGLAFGPR